jgi:hypothetical protein
MGKATTPHASSLGATCHPASRTLPDRRASSSVLLAARKPFDRAGERSEAALEALAIAAGAMAHILV